MAGFDPVTAVLNLGSTLIDRLIPDKTAAAAAKSQMVDMQIAGEFQTTLAQIQVNQAEAGSQSVFVAGWRPFVGWICGIALGYVYILQPLIVLVAVLSHSTFDATKLPSVSLSDMLPILLGMLGLGAMRSFDKTTGNSNGH